MRLFIFMFFAVMIYVAPHASAQNINERDLRQLQAELGAPPELTGGGANSMFAPSVSYEDLTALLFTQGQLELIEDARQGNVIQSNDEDAPQGPREVSLSGIAYVTSNDWTIWLNNMRITPEAIPNNILDLKVHKNFIEIQWLDRYTNQVFPIRLRPHQRFNLDTRIFLPG